jgi:3-isopropylmalate/(R)-2-methylmalate dehydratase small subunit
MRIHCARNGLDIEAAPIPPELLKLLDAGGLVPYLRKHSTL